MCVCMCFVGIIFTVIGGVKATDVADAADPLIHLLLGVSHQVKDTVNGLDVKDEAVLQVLLVERQPRVHLRFRTATEQLVRKSCQSVDLDLQGLKFHIIQKM